MPDLYQIHNLVCGYRSNKKEVLHVPSLDIPSGKLIVMLGLSGSGKSTLLETLGLMNETIFSGEVIFNPLKGPPPDPFSVLWNKRKFRQIAAIRRQYFSFIFQSTNLMPNFTAIENACLMQMIKDVGRKEAESSVRESMNDMFLKDIPTDKKARDLSGGEKQRLAFVRAITPGFTVLFGDEPTGNLDPFLSETLMEILRRELTKNQRTAVVVSHNIDLSLDYADMLIVITPSGKNQPFVVKQENVFKKDTADLSWTNGEGFKIPQIREKIISLMSPPK